MKKWLKRILYAFIIFTLIGFLALESLRYIAFQNGVKEVNLPKNSKIKTQADKAGYIDAYQFILTEDFNMETAEFGQGKEMSRTENEILFKGGAPGLKFLASYHLNPENSKQFTLSTVVHYESTVGQIYFFFVKPFHRRVVPYFLYTMMK